MKKSELKEVIRGILRETEWITMDNSSTNPGAVQKDIDAIMQDIVKIFKSNKPIIAKNLKVLTNFSDGYAYFPKTGAKSITVSWDLGRSDVARMDMYEISPSLKKKVETIVKKWPNHRRPAISDYFRLDGNDLRVTGFPQDIKKMIKDAPINNTDYNKLIKNIESLLRSVKWVYNKNYRAARDLNYGAQQDKWYFMPNKYGIKQIELQRDSNKMDVELDKSTLAKMQGIFGMFNIDQYGNSDSFMIKGMHSLPELVRIRQLVFKDMDRLLRGGQPGGFMGRG